jgi:hypothetical protein
VVGSLEASDLENLPAADFREKLNIARAGALRNDEVVVDEVE